MLFRVYCNSARIGILQVVDDVHTFIDLRGRQTQAVGKLARVATTLALNLSRIL